MKTWQCIDCEKEFKSHNIGIICPFCGGTCVINCLDVCQSEIDDAIDSLDCSEQDYIDAGLEMPEYIEEQIADMYATMKDLIPETPEHPKCPCTDDFDKDSFNMASIDWIRNNPVIQAPLSFDDMEINEKLLIGLPIADIRVAPLTYVTEMNERFLHTFIDDCFVS